MKNIGPSRPWLHPGIIIRNSPIHGKGFFAKMEILEGERVVVWGGCYTDSKGAELARMQGLGTMQWDDDIFSYESDIYPDAFSINHSCEPNTWMEDAYTLTTMRKINVSEEMTMDYVQFLTEDNPPEWTCNCGTENCRGRLTSSDWKRAELQAKYKGHFSPLLNKRIAQYLKSRC